MLRNYFVLILRHYTVANASRASARKAESERTTEHETTPLTEVSYPPLLPLGPGRHAHAATDPWSLFCCLHCHHNAHSCSFQTAAPAEHTGHMLCRSASLPRTALQAPFRLPAAVMCGAVKCNSSSTATATQWSDTPLAKGQYAKELDTACLAVQLASKLCRTVQQQLSSSETAGKQDDSPVTVADYGELTRAGVHG
jgi:hypothetical protein